MYANGDNFYCCTALQARSERKLYILHKFPVASCTNCLYLPQSFAVRHYCDRQRSDVRAYRLNQRKLAIKFNERDKLILALIQN